MSSPLMTVREVATAFSVTPRTVRNWVETGKLAAVQTPSGRYRFQREAIEAMIGEDAA